ncbi:MAG: nucleoside hydrolase [Firmicutes bacterium]|jgi:purine nucleosidase|nr:nucleoside hydrolase [Bacillota bacterium]
MADKIPVLFDTDIGSDIDDALCLAYLLHQERCDLLGITTVSGEPVKRAMLADAVCKAAGRSGIPIHAGCEKPLLIDQKQPLAPQAEILGRWPHREDFEPNSAVQFLRDTIRSRPGEITLLAVGPLTNIGMLFRLDPEIPSLLKELVLMGGAFSFPLEDIPMPLEWNIIVDPHAASIVFSAEDLPITAIGLDVTTKCVMLADECRRKIRGGVLDVVADAAEVWFKIRPAITFHDPLAAVAMFDPDVVSYEQGRVRVELASEDLKGMTVFTPDGEKGRHKVAREVDPDRFFAEYFKVAGKDS